MAQRKNTFQKLYGGSCQKRILPRFTTNWVLRKIRNGHILQVRGRCKGHAGTYLSTGIYVEPGQFVRETLTIVGDPSSTFRIRQLQADIQRVFLEQETMGRTTHPDEVMKIVLGIRSRKCPTIQDAIRLFVEAKKELVGAEIQERTFKRYEQYEKILTAFFTKKYGANTDIRDLKPILKDHFLKYCKVERNYVHNYFLKIFGFLRSILDYAVAYEWVDRNVLKHIRLRKEKTDPRVLSMEEIEKLKGLSFDDQTLTHVRDCFLFSCYTGLAYVDMAALRKEHIINVNGIKAILKKRQKSGVQFFTPLFPDAIALLKKYENHEICTIKGVLLPAISNQKMNSWLKIIGQTAGIKEKLHTHMARKTFTLYAEELGFDLTQTATMMGHTNASMTEALYFKRRKEPVIKRYKELFADLETNQN
ncbi:site-specific integrase [Arsenicibacter rosenii]|uniref:Tyr recombinase domain-containing protein n=1 Tax=Arsenicibacter rosenii TaxID=1750698 RepID=A0A1S2VIS0_9BACT|nr:site-specific integrase [Arsenicibacter rosenii]OIN58639.1 hypothetical protein BLX24_13815 [Arsenicibacter rosenii]